MKHMTRLSLSLAGALLLAAPAMAQTKWNLPAAYPPDNFHTENLNAFAKDVPTPPAASCRSRSTAMPRCSRRRRSSAQCRPARPRPARC